MNHPFITAFPVADPLLDKSTPAPIRSFVRRQGRISGAQQHALDQLFERWGLVFCHPDDPRWPTEFLGGSRPLVLDLGFGMGESTLATALKHPQINYLAIDVHRPGIGSLLQQVQNCGCTNLRVMEHDAVAVIRDMLRPESLDGVHIYFPDPWPKARHHKRRLVQPDFVALLSGRVRPGGYIHLATDWEDYAQQMLRVLKANPGLMNTAQDFAARPLTRPLTKFEQRGLNLGHSIRDLIFRKRGP